MSASPLRSTGQRALDLLEVLGFAGVAERLVARSAIPRRWLSPAPPGSGGPPRAPALAVTAVVEPAGPSPGVRHLSLHVEGNLATLHRLADLRGAEDPVAAVHDVRVAARRLRAFVEAFPAALAPEDSRRPRRLLRRARRRLGKRRDADVAAATVVERSSRAASPERAVALEHVAEREEARRRRLVRRRRHAIRDSELAWLSSTLRAALDVVAEIEASRSGGFEVLAWTALEPPLEALSAALAGTGDDPTAAGLHQVRIAAKKLRYAVEIVRPALGDHYAAIHGALRGMQSLLGAIQDAQVLGELLEGHAARLAARGRRALAAALHAERADLEREREERVSRFLAERGAIDPGALGRLARTALALP